MMRRAGLGLILLLLLTPAVCLAQAEFEAAPAQEAEEALPSFAGHLVMGEAVVDLADFVCSYLEQAGTIPDVAQVAMADGTVRSLSAAETFVLLARTAYLWEVSGGLPETVPISPDEVRPPVLDAEDVVAPPRDPEEGREIPTDPFLAQCAAVVRWIDRLQVVPTAVWVDGQRLSAAKYMAGLAICVSFAYWEEELYASIFIPPYAAPRSWVGTATPTSDTGSEEEYEEWYEEGSDPEAESYQEEGGGETLPLSDEAPQRLYEGEPLLYVVPEPGATVSGLADVAASYRGPPARFVLFDVDGRESVIINFPPYVYRWDTTKLEPGTHTIRVQVLGDEDRVLADQSSIYIVVAPEGEGASEPSDDL